MRGLVAYVGSSIHQTAMLPSSTDGLMATALSPTETEEHTDRVPFTNEREAGEPDRLSGGPDPAPPAAEEKSAEKWPVEG